MEEKVGKKKKGKGKGKGEGEDANEPEEPSPSHFKRIPPEVLLKVLSLLDGKTLMVSIPQVCKRWRALCQDIRNVHLDCSLWKGVVPVEVLAGFQQRSFVLSANAGSCGGGSSSDAAADEDEEGGGGWKSGLCELFPRTTSVKMNGENDVEDAHLMALADKCPGITHAHFGYCANLTDVALLALADKCHGITHANFGDCVNLTDAAVAALADKCPGITHADFSFCRDLTDAAKEAATAQRQIAAFSFKYQMHSFEFNLAAAVRS